MQKSSINNNSAAGDNATLVPQMPLWLSVLPITLLLGVLIRLIVTIGPDAINQWSPFVLLGSAALAVALALPTRRLTRGAMRRGIRISCTQILPAVPLLALIALVSTTWMLSGIVPTLIDYGLKYLNPTLFLSLTCICCALVSLLTGSSWTTIATMGVAFMGIGTVLGYSEPWTAGAIISGAYFGDKVSPLSDTTVVASSSCGVDLFRHIRYMFVTTTPALLAALTVFTIVGFTSGGSADHAGDPELLGALHSTFNITPWVLVVPLITGILIACRINTLLVLCVSAALGTACIWIAQPQLAAGLNPVTVLLSDTTLSTGSARLDELAATSGLMGMVPTICLVLCAMVFGAAMLGTGMLASIAGAFTRRLRRRTSIVGATACSGLALNCCTADQYLALIVGANMYRDVYSKFGLEHRLLSRTLEDSVSVTSVLIPWNSCGVTQSAVLGVATLSYLPCCVFNYLSPVFTIIVARLGWKIPAPVLPAIDTDASSLPAIDTEVNP